MTRARGPEHMLICMCSALTYDDAGVVCCPANGDSNSSTANVPSFAVVGSELVPCTTANAGAVVGLHLSGVGASGHLNSSTARNLLHSLQPSLRRLHLDANPQLYGTWPGSSSASAAGLQVDVRGTQLHCGEPPTGAANGALTGLGEECALPASASTSSLTIITANPGATLLCQQAVSGGPSADAASESGVVLADAGFWWYQQCTCAHSSEDDSVMFSVVHASPDSVMVVPSCTGSAVSGSGGDSNPAAVTAAAVLGAVLGAVVLAVAAAGGYLLYNIKVHQHEHMSLKDPLSLQAAAASWIAGNSVLIPGSGAWQGPWTCSLVRTFVSSSCARVLSLCCSGTSAHAWGDRWGARQSF